MKFASIALFLVSLSAFADAPNMIGTWSSPCGTEEGYSFINRVTFRADGVAVNEDVFFTNTTCAGSPAGVETAEAKYTTDATTADAVEMTITPNAAGEGQAVTMKVRFTSVNATTVQMKLLAATVVVEGRKVEVPADQIEAIPAVPYTKN